MEGGEITSKYFVCTCVLIYILLWFMQIIKEKKKEIKKSQMFFGGHQIHLEKSTCTTAL